MLDPYHKPMESVGECDHANDHIADLEAKLAAAEERARELEAMRHAFTHLRAHVDDGTESCAVCRGVVREYDRKAARLTAPAPKEEK